MVSKGAGAAADVMSAVRGTPKITLPNSSNQSHYGNSAKRNGQNYIKVDPKTGEIYE